MIEPKRIGLTVRTERAILIRVVLASEPDDADPFMELEQLAGTAGAKVVDSVVQKRQKVDPAFYLGRGKADELAALCSGNNIDVIICDHDLNPSQVKNLEMATNTKVVDRSELILDIFATHARTNQAKLQVELAQKEYMLPRLKHLWTHLERIEGGIGTRGPGEKQLEIDRRLASKKIADLRKRLNKIERSKQQELSSRKNATKISLVGYTNSGKSTLMNALTGADVLVEDKLFATLDTKTRNLCLTRGKTVLLSDTVGFIDKLPHHLISSFNATLEEAKQADILIHVADISSPYCDRQIEAVNKVLHELGCSGKTTLMVFNKTDVIDDVSPVAILQKRYENSVVISARTGEGINDLKRLIVDNLEREYKEVDIVFDSRYSKLVSDIFSNTNVLDNSFHGNEIRMKVTASSAQLNRLNKLSRQTAGLHLQITTSKRMSTD